MFIHFLCFCPLRLAIMLNFNISKVAYWSVLTVYFKHVNRDLAIHRGDSNENVNNARVHHILFCTFHYRFCTTMM